MQNDFLTYLANQVDALRTRWSLSEGQAFMMWYALEALELGEDVAYEAVSYDGGNDKDIDLFYLDEQHQRILIAQGKFNRKGDYKAKKKVLLALVHSTDWLGNREAISREGRDDLVPQPTTIGRALRAATVSNTNTCSSAPATRT